MKIQTVGSKLIVEQDKPKEMSDGGVYIPDQSRKLPGKGTVICIGPDVQEVAVGDVVFFNQYDGNLLELDSTEYTIIDTEKILLYLRKE